MVHVLTWSIPLYTVQIPNLASTSGLKIAQNLGVKKRHPDLKLWNIYKNSLNLFINKNSKLN